MVLRLIVVEGDRQVVEEGQHRLLAQQQSFNEVTGGRLLSAPAPRWPRQQGRARGQSGGEQGIVAGDEGVAPGWVELRQSMAACLLCRRFHHPRSCLRSVAQPW